MYDVDKSGEIDKHEFIFMITEIDRFIRVFSSPLRVYTFAEKVTWPEEKYNFYLYLLIMVMACLERQLVPDCINQNEIQKEKIAFSTFKLYTSIYFLVLSRYMFKIL